MAEENARLASQLANIQFAGCQTTIYGSTPNATKEIQALRTELFDLQSRETMLRLELERVQDCLSCGSHHWIFCSRP